MSYHTKIACTRILQTEDQAPSQATAALTPAFPAAAPADANATCPSAKQLSLQHDGHTGHFLSPSFTLVFFFPIFMSGHPYLLYLNDKLFSVISRSCKMLGTMAPCGHDHKKWKE